MVADLEQVTLRNAAQAREELRYQILGGDEKRLVPEGDYRVAEFGEVVGLLRIGSGNTTLKDGTEERT